MKNSIKLNSLSASMEKGLDIRRGLKSDFLNKLLEVVPDFNEIESKDIINIVYGNNYSGYVSTGKICEVAGIKIGHIEQNEHINGSIKIIDEKINILYDAKCSKEERRIIRSHEIGHLFKHLIVGVKVISSNEHYLAGSYKNTDKLLSNMEEMQENEANQFSEGILKHGDM